MKDLMLGQKIYVGWNAAKQLGDDIALAYDKALRVEAVGYDWLVVRNTYEDGKAYAATFDSIEDKEDFLSEVTDKEILP